MYFLGTPRKAHILANETITSRFMYSIAANNRIWVLLRSTIAHLHICM